MVFSMLDVLFHDELRVEVGGKFLEVVLNFRIYILVDGIAELFLDRRSCQSKDARSLHT